MSARQRISISRVRREWIVAAVLGGALGAAGIASGVTGASKTEEPPLGRPGSYATASDSHGRGINPPDAAADVAKRLRGTRVGSVAVVTAPIEAKTSSLPWVKVQTDLPKSVYSVWLASLAQGATADLASSTQERTADVVGGGELVSREDDGSTQVTQLGSGSVAARQDFSSPSDAELEVRAQAVANRFGLTLNSVHVFHPLSSAVAVDLTVPDGPVSWTIDQLRAALEGSPQDIEGSFVRLRSPAGVELLESGTAYRTGAGGLSFAPGQDTRFSATHGGTPGK